MPNLLFWNLKRGSAESYLAALCLENAVDILILAEDFSAAGHIPSLLNLGVASAPFAEIMPVVSTRVRLYTRLKAGTVRRVADHGDRISIFAYQGALGPPMLIAAAHLPSKLHLGDREQHHYAGGLRNAIEQAERDHGHNHSIIIGDLNMNPFEDGMAAFDGLHAVMDKAVASKVGRRFAGSTSNFFYNPMWSRIGDESAGPPGTYYYSSGGLVNHYWNMFDQLLLRPSLLPYYEADQLRIITRIGDRNLVSRDRIDSSISDHLPLFVQIDLERS